MKVLKEGTLDWKPWWAGQKIECTECHRMVLLEEGDDIGECKIKHNFNSMSLRPCVNYKCEKCGTQNSITRPKNS